MAPLPEPTPILITPHEGRDTLVVKIQTFCDQVQTTHRQLTENVSDGSVVGDLFLEMVTDQVTTMTRQLTLQLLAFHHTKSLGHAQARRMAYPFLVTSTVDDNLRTLDVIERAQAKGDADVIFRNWNSDGTLAEDQNLLSPALGRIISAQTRNDAYDSFPGEEGGEAIDLRQPRTAPFHIKLTIPKKTEAVCKTSVADAAMDEQADMAVTTKITQMIDAMTIRDLEELALLRDRIKLKMNNLRLAWHAGVGE